MMYQDTNDMIRSTIRMPRWKYPPCVQSVIGPYGFSTSCLVAKPGAAFSIDSSIKKKAGLCGPGLDTRLSVLQFEFHAEAETVGARHAIDATGDVAPGLGELDRSFIQPRVA